MDLFEKKFRNRKISVFGLFTIPADRFPGTLFQRCLDTSVTGKLVGMLIVSLLGFLLVISLNSYALFKIAKHNHAIRDISIPEYKVSQYILRSINGFKLSLLHTLDAKKISKNDNNLLANQQRLADIERMVHSLQNGGAVIDVAKVSKKTLDVFRVEPSISPVMKELIEQLNDECSLLRNSYEGLVAMLFREVEEDERDYLVEKLLQHLENIYTLALTMTVEINSQHGEKFRELDEIINTSIARSSWVGLGIAVLLTMATVFYILIIVVPLHDILEKIAFIAKGEGDRAHHIEVKSNDEVGQLAMQLNKLVDNIFSLNTFKAVIEEEETTAAVNQRLASQICDRYKCNKLYIYEVTGVKNNMSVAFSSGYADVCSAEILDDANYCRAKRTGHPVSSLEFPDICKQFPHSERMEHHCIPMLANGTVVGVVQFLLDRGCSTEEKKKFYGRVNRATRYIKEATPVLEAKRFASALQETTLKDPLTDLYNRRFLESYSDTLVSSTLRKKTKVGILMCDMDFFKEVNDKFGHETGDVVLVKTAEVLNKCVRISDMVIRYGGEEFIVLLMDINSRDNMLEIAEKIRAAMEGTIINVPDGTLKKTMSIGGVLFPDDSDGLWEAIKFADVALYRAKSDGRNRVTGFSEEMWKEETY